MKYLAYYKKEFIEFNNYHDLEYFLLDKPNVRYKKITSKKVEKEFKELCENSPIYQQKIYIAINGNQIKRFASWDECKKYINLNENSKYKSFASEEEAQIFINNNVKTQKKDLEDVLYCVINEPKKTKINYILMKNGIQISQNDKIFSYKEIYEHELISAIEAIKEAISLKEERIIIIYNNKGVELWANGSWQTKKEITKKYKEDIDKYKKQINIDFLACEKAGM